MTSSATLLFVFGGCDAQGRCNDLHVFDTATCHWSQMPTSPDISGRGGPALAVSRDGNVLYAACGYSGQENDDVHAFDINAKAWRVCVASRSGLFEARSVVGCCTLPDAQGGGIVIFGGETATSAKGHDGAGNFASDLVYICPVTGGVSVAAVAGDLRPCARGWMALAAWEEEEEGGECGAVMFGGLTGDDDAPVRLGDTWQLRLSAAV
jgi:hypothetical protein